MAYKTLIFGTDDLFNDLRTHYEREIQRGTFEIVAYAVLDKGNVTLVTPNDRPGGG